MPRKNQYFFLFFSLFFSAIVILLVSTTAFFRPVRSLAELSISPLQHVTSFLFSISQTAASSTSLVEENRKLLSQITKLKETEKEYQALKKQFQNTPVSPAKLLPAQIVGRRTFVPGVSESREILINKGAKDGLKKGMVVIIEDMVVGKVATVSERMSRVSLITQSTGTTAKTLDTNALGVIQKQGDTLVFGNVVLSEKISPGDIVITVGEQDESGLGYPPGLIIGKIISIDKKPSALFQAAEVTSPIILSRETTVFVIMP